MYISTHARLDVKSREREDSESVRQLLLPPQLDHPHLPQIPLDARVLLPLLNVHQLVPSLLDAPQLTRPLPIAET